MSTVKCRWCGESYSTDLLPDSTKDGFWCDTCDGFTFFHPEAINEHRLLLILEEKASASPLDTATARPRLRKQLSPLRYPGGKSKLIDYLYTKLSHKNLDTFVELYAGGASLGLSLLDGGIINHLILNEKDPCVYAFWRTALNSPQQLIARLQANLPTHHDLAVAKQKIASYGPSEPDLAWHYLLANRLSYSGIAKANPLGGKNGTQEALLARWKPQKLIQRIESIHSMRDRIQLFNEDGCSFLQDHAYWNDHSTIFIDPPYYEKGAALYPFPFTDRDHVELAETVQMLWREFPSPDVIITYDNHPRIRELYPLAQKEIIQRRYSI